MSKSVFITGASSGLGEGMARHFASRGYRLALAARRTDRLATLARELEREAGDVVVIELDVVEFDLIPEALERARQSFDGLDVVVANAGVGPSTPTGRGRMADIRKTIDVNLTAAIATVEAAVELFLKQGHGHVAAVTPVAKLRGLPGQSAYSASKSGLSRYLEAVRLELRGKNIGVTELAPGYIDTDLNRHIKSRPFVVDAVKGTAEMVDTIEKGSASSYIPAWPWTLVAQVLKVLPGAAFPRPSSKPPADSD